MNSTLEKPSRYYQYWEYNQEDPIIVSDAWIIDHYYQEWSKKMIRKYGEEVFNSTYSFEHCIDDFCTLHYASLIE